MATIAVIGAGGKMGFRIIENLSGRDHELLPVEVGQAGIEQLATRGLTPVGADEAVGSADVVILAVPDAVIGDVASELVPKAAAGTMFIVLDAAAPHAGLMPKRGDVTYIVCHPCHPSVFVEIDSPEAQVDYFGGTAARQNVVCALMQGPEEDYEKGAAIVGEFFAPTDTVYRVTVEQLVILEPALSETTAATCLTVIREAMDEAVSRGVPPEAARAFILGHLRVELAIIFDLTDYPLSDGALKAIDTAKPQIFRDDWRRVFDQDRIDASVEAIVGEPVRRD